MSLPRFYHPGLSSRPGRITLQGDEAAHAIRSRRLAAGDRVTLIDGAGSEADAAISSLPSRSVVELTVDGYRTVPEPLASRLTVAVAVCKPQRQAWMVEKLTELGVGVICPINCRRSTVRANPATVRRWHRRCIEALKQSGQAWAPQLRDATPVELFASASPSCDLRLLADPGPTSAPVLDRLPVVRHESTVSVIIGPEGGLTQDETAAAVTAGFVPVRLGRAILRVETAAVALAAAIVAHLERTGE